MAIGAGVSLFSRYVQKRGGEGLAIFFWAGIAMIGIGVFKIIIGFVFKPKKNSEEENKKESIKHGLLQKLAFNKDLDKIDVQKNMQTLQNEKQQAVKNINETAILVCTMCGTKHYSNSNFCHMCGSRLK